MQIKSLKIFGAFFAIYFIWGTTFLAIRFAVDTIPPFLMMGTRFSLAGSLLFIISSIRNYQRPSLLDIKKAAITGTFMVFLGYSTLSWAQQYINSGLAALMLATIPIWMVLIDWLVLKGSRPSLPTIIGIIVGFIGVAIITRVDEKSFIKLSVTPELALITCLITIFSALVFAIGSLYVKNVTIKISLLSFIGLQMILGGIALIILGIVSGEVTQDLFENITLNSGLSLFYLIIVGTTIAHSSYFWLLKVSTPAKVSTYAFFNPIVAIFVGWIIAGENIDGKLILGMITILIAILLVIRPLGKVKVFEIVQKFKNSYQAYISIIKEIK